MVTVFALVSSSCLMLFPNVVCLVLVVFIRSPVQIILKASGFLVVVAFGALESNFANAELLDIVFCAAGQWAVTMGPP